MLVVRKSWEVPKLIKIHTEGIDAREDVSFAGVSHSHCCVGALPFAAVGPGCERALPLSERWVRARVLAGWPTGRGQLFTPTFMVTLSI